MRAGIRNQEERPQRERRRSAAANKTKREGVRVRRGVLLFLLLWRNVRRGRSCCGRACGRTLVQHMYFCQPAVVFCPRVSRGATMGWAVTFALVWRQGGRTEHVTRGKVTCFPKRKVSAGRTFGEEEVRSDAGETEGGVLQKYKRKLR